MIFKQWEQVVGLKEPPKGQTRRPVKPHEYAPFAVHCGDSAVEYGAVMRGGRKKWQVGRTYAVQRPDKKSMGRFLLTKIRREPLQDISLADMIAEGVGPTLAQRYPFRYRNRLYYEFEELWESIYRQTKYRYLGYRWKDNPDVWVLEWPPMETG